MIALQLQSIPYTLMSGTPAPRFMEQFVGILVDQAMPTPINTEALTPTQPNHDSDFVESPTDCPKRMFKTRMMEIHLFFIETQMTVHFQNLNFSKTATVV